jgi:hypothetical protein
MKQRLLKKIKSQSGTSRIIYIFGLIALALVMFIVLSKTTTKVDSGMDSVDKEQVIFAERQAEIEFQQSRKAFSLVFDTNNKRFVDKKTARSTVTPYGTSKEHQGKYLLVTVDEEGGISSKWISP